MGSPEDIAALHTIRDSHTVHTSDVAIAVVAMENIRPHEVEKWSGVFRYSVWSSTGPWSMSGQTSVVYDPSATVNACYKSVFCCLHSATI